jgi:hypothetical protein
MRNTIALAVLLILAGGCPRQEQDVSQNSPPKTSTTATPSATTTDEKTATMNPILPPQSDLPSSRVPAVAQPEIAIELTEYSIKVPPTIPAGHQTLSVVNTGKEAHSLAIEAEGHEFRLPEPIRRGDRGTLVVELKRGKYSVYCPVDNHKGKGMVTTVEVR